MQTTRSSRVSPHASIVSIHAGRPTPQLFRVAIAAPRHGPRSRQMASALAGTPAWACAMSGRSRASRRPSASTDGQKTLGSRAKKSSRRWDAPARRRRWRSAGQSRPPRERPVVTTVTADPAARCASTSRTSAPPAPLQRNGVTCTMRRGQRGPRSRSVTRGDCSVRRPCYIVRAMPWSQVYDPFGAMWLSTLVAALPVIVLLGGLALFKWHAHTAAVAGLAAALVVAIGAFHMPVPMALATAGVRRRLRPLPDRLDRGQRHLPLPADQRPRPVHGAAREHHARDRRPAAAAAARRLLVRRLLRGRGRLRHPGGGHRGDPDGPRLQAARRRPACR